LTFSASGLTRCPTTPFLYKWKITRFGVLHERQQTLSVMTGADPAIFPKMPALSGHDAEENCEL
jgi:hypothetical protein